MTLAVLSIGCAAPAFATAVRPHYRVRATVSLAEPQIDGVVDVTFTNESQQSVSEAVFVLFANRFAVAEAEINDFNRPFIYPEEDFNPGRIEIIEARDAEAMTVAELTALRLTGEEPQSLPNCLLRVQIAPLSPSRTRTISLRFRTTVPYRFGSFGRFEHQLTVNGGWYPSLAALGADGTWLTEAPPPLADFDVALTLPVPLEGVLNGSHFSRQSVVRAELTGVHYVSLVAAPQLLHSETTVGSTRIVLLRRPRHRVSRISTEPALPEAVLTTLHDIIEQRPAAVPAAPAELVVVEAPLRLNLTAPGEGMVLVSDRALSVHWLLRPFHEMQLAQALYSEVLRPLLSAREPDSDYGWVSEGVSRVFANRFVSETRPGTRSVQDWIEQLNIFAIVDRFESVPKIPFVDAFFERARLADPLRTEVATFNSALPPGRVILGKLREVVGPEKFDGLIDRCIGAPMPFRACASAQADPDVAWVFEQWLQAYPELNYRFQSVELNESREGPGSLGAYGPEGGREIFHHEVTVVRESSRPIREPVTVRLRSVGGRDVDVRWDGEGTIGELSTETPQRVCQAVIDPERRLIEDRRDDNARPPSPQVVLDTAEVEITSTEFGFSGLVVGRPRYDYRKDLAVAGFYTNRSIGFDAGVRQHWGTPIDATSFPHNVYAFYGFQELNGSFADERRPSVRTPGQSAALGVRYDYTNLFAYDNPTHERNVRLYADWYDRGLGGNFNYVDWGASVVVTQPLWSYRTIAAGQLLNGFSEPLGSSVVPNQGLYSLGGSRSIRGIGAEDELGRNILLVRAEVRQEVYPELDLNLFDLLVLRRAQVRLFADSGRVDNAAGRVYDVSRFAVGVGTGLAAVYDFLGFFPSIAYIEIATRVDESRKAGDVQVLFGTRQSF